MKVNFETTVPVDVKEPGAVTVYGDKFFGILNSAPDGELEFEQSDTKFLIKTSSKRVKFQLKSIASEKFPEFTASSKEFFDIPIKDFKDMIQETIFAVSDDETRYFMNGVFFEKTEDKFVMVATDGRRLAYISKTAQKVEDFTGIIIPPKILNLITKRSGDEGMISLSVTDKTIYVQFGAYKLSSVLIEGNFPSYNKVIPKEQTRSFTFDRLEMLDALKRVSLFVEQKSHRVYLDVAPGTVSIYCEENEIGDAREEIPCKYNGEEVTIALNYRYIEEPFKVMNGKEISIHFTDPTKAITIMPEPACDFFHIVMPMQTD
jgi:DNA polymerase-3 subunit beta